MRPSHLALGLSICTPLLATPLLADVITVPGDAYDLQAAIDLAQPGDVIEVFSLSDQNSNGTVSIGMPLTIRGMPVCNINLQAPGLNAAGLGSGRLVLENVVARYSSTDSSGELPLNARDFTEVVLINCEFVHDNVAASGLITESFPAMVLSGVDRLTVIDSQILGGPAGADDCVFSMSAYVDGRDGIVAAGTDVLLVGSSVAGGRGGFLESSVFPCPANFPDWPGKAGNGIVARSVTRIDSTVTGGTGATWRSLESGSCFSSATYVTCGTHPDGAPFILTEGLNPNAAALSTDLDAISLSTGGVQTLSLAADPALAGSIYLLAGSFGGASPGLPLGSFVLPLDASDSYFSYSVLNANGPVLGSTLGVLDSDGRGDATVTLTPAIPASLAGQIATHAFVVADASLQALAVSNATTLELLP